MDSLFDLTGKIAIVTGASTGLGAGIAVALARAGADLVGVARSDQAQTARAVEDTGRRFWPIQADVSQLGAAEQIVSETLSQYGRIDILVNNAGIAVRKDVFDYTQQDWDATLDLDLRGVFFLSQAVARCFVEQGQGGKIINIASMLSFQGGLRVAAYAAAKGGVRTLTQALCNEWAPYSINVNAIAPGYMATRINTQLMEDPVRGRQILERIPAGRWGRPEDLDGAVVFLASRASDYVDGITLPVDGGWLAR